MTRFLLQTVTATSLALFASNAAAQTCPPPGARYVIKGFTGDTGVTATGGESDRRYGCKWQTDDGRELWWNLGEDVVPADRKAAPAGPAPAPAAGSVYECTLPGIGLFTGAYFGIVDGKTYRNIDGKDGRYSFDATTGVLKFTSGPSKGLAYKRMPEGTFRVLDDKGAITGGNCVHNRAKKIDGRW